VLFIWRRTAPLVLEFCDIEKSSGAVYYGLPPGQEGLSTSHLVEVFTGALVRFASGCTMCVPVCRVVCER
jgi:hypothetical protein